MRTVERCFSWRRWMAFAAGLCVAAALAGCSAMALQTADDSLHVRLASLGPTDVIILGEQHDAPEHQQLERKAVTLLADRGELQALVIEMAEQGRSTEGLRWFATEGEVQQALGWDEQAWPWFAYGPAIIKAVRAGVPVYGGNLPRAGLPAAMADASLDALLDADALKLQQQAIRDGHCQSLPESQITPMARVQIARDRAMAQAVARAVRPGRPVLLVTGAGHADLRLGVARHLPKNLRVRTVKLWATGTQPGTEPMPRGFDDVWRTYPLPQQDYCARITARQQL
ncbi:ChaN family lipoprotein [Ramlibacter sp. H39-3-26]|uniref:ChaN family lipoprotein n=1 Tax=Curvibacter soli TaxID=3031331 RepID=UPI0023DBEA06|nr:ChaN family lipoprotein [Ramlibacter sp. H39-3-26]MDF1486266.1 ChaN family lipoprotein [Ramlibacter sp. H39-3-26]